MRSNGQAVYRLLFSPLDYFRIFTGEEMLMLFADETNKYAIKCNANILQKHECDSSRI